ncbi:MAG: SufE family protein [Rikenellaceae bacterium]
MLDKIQEEIISEFEIFDEWLDKYNYLIELSADLPLIASEHKTESYVIQGCQSRVWIDAQLNAHGEMEFSADSDAIITKGIIALLVRVLNNRMPQEVLDIQLYFIDKIGLSQNLSPARANGLVAMIKQMRLFATAYLSRENR